MKTTTEFEAAVSERTLSVGVVGLGYVGLPLVVGYAETGFRAVGFDLNEPRIQGLSAGHSHIEDIESARIAAVVNSGKMLATSDLADLSTVDVVFVCVPTPHDDQKTPDLSFIQSAAASVASILRPGMLVILQSTTSPGTTTQIMQPILEETGLRSGIDFMLAFSPERVDPGNVRFTVRNTPKVVGGVNEQSTQCARALLEAVMDEPGLVTCVSSPDAAEMTKLLENTYRAVNIALVNELAVLSEKMGIDLWEVISAASTKPFGFQAFWPGIGPGGHCIPVDPYYLSWKARAYDFQTKFIELAADTNLGMADYVCLRVSRFLNRREKTLNGAKVLALGVAFKEGVSDTRNSRAVQVIKLLEAEGAIVDYADPMVPSITISGRERQSINPDAINPNDYDVVLVLVKHLSWPIGRWIESGAHIFDAVNAGGVPTNEQIERL
ncbi:MAG: nucleotide sugar dehydrogenase [Acidimicrobiia bacterium]|nr:nucleotide sugar dehydrogenase [Acidimicrobiia bacterium]